MELRNPTKKGFKLPPFTPPFPICNKSTDTIYLNEYDWPIFTGKFNGNCVIIDDTSEIIALSKKGFFGKGSLSKGSPSICKRKAPLNVINESQWKRRREWSESLRNVLLESQDASCHIEEGTDGKLAIAEKQNRNSTSEENSTYFESSTGTKELKEGHSTKESKLDSENNSTTKVQTESSKSGEHKLSHALKKNKETEIPKSGKPMEIETKFSEEIKSDNIDDKAEKINYTTENKIKNKLLDDSEVLVITDIGNNVDEPLKNLNPHIEREEIKTVIEVLFLSLEEAFFLSFALNCLQVLDLSGKYLSNKEMWKLYQNSQTDFMEKYVAYHHFRSKGWVVKSGVKYGGDFLLYKKGPLYYHASYIGIVKLLNPDGTNNKGKNVFSWDKMLTLNRMSETAMKEILICEVIKPDLPEESFFDPSVLKEFKVSEVLLRRWQPTQEQDG